MLISQCMIVRNEEKNIRKALSWGRGIVDEQIVVDTGSTDQTVAIAKELGAAVYHFTWVDDFSAAKNFAISKCTGDWICFLDADEYFAEEDANRLRETLSVIDGKILPIHGRRRRIDAIMTPLVNLTASHEILNRVSQIRIFRRSERIRYSGKIHEVLMAQGGGDLVGEKIDNMLTVYHTGYSWTPADGTRKEKGERNLAPILEHLRKYPHDAMYHLYAADAYNLLYDDSESYRHAMLALAHADESRHPGIHVMGYQQALYSMYRLIASGRDMPIETVLAEYDNACRYAPDHPDFTIALGLCYSALHMHQKARTTLERIPLIHDESYVVPPLSKIMPYLPLVYRALSEACMHEADLNAAVRYAMKLLEMNFYAVGSIGLLITIFQKGDTSASDILSFLLRLYSLDNKRDVACLIEAFRSVGSIALAQLLLEKV